MAYLFLFLEDGGHPEVPLLEAGFISRVEGSSK